MSVQVEPVRTHGQRRAFVAFPFRLYRGCPQWVPPLWADALLPLRKDKHPFYEHSDADFFLARRDGEVVGRIAVLENTRFNAYHGTRQAAFYFFDFVDDPAVSAALVEAAVAWARRRGLTALVGPKGFAAFDGYGVLVEGFEHRQMMTMMNYNYPYYARHLEALGFVKEVDFFSYPVDVATFRVPERFWRVAEKVRRRYDLRVVTLRSRKDVRYWAPKVGQAYNETFIHNWEYYPLTEREIAFLAQNLQMVVRPELMKLIVHGAEARVVGFLLGFPDVSEALQRARGRLWPWNLVRLWRALYRTDTISLNGAGVHPRFQGRGGNVLLYTEMERTIRTSGQFRRAELTQVAETATQMQQDLARLGVRPYKRHRVYRLTWNA